MTYLLDTRDGYIRRMITVGRRMGIAPRGIVIGIATALVESNVKVYANRAVPESMKLPHDDVGSDSKSVGLYQQQVRRGDNGEWWWGSAEECMSPERSSELFYERLKRKPYQWASSDLAAGSIAQEIQQSAFPDRYGQRMGEAQQLYDRLSTEKERPMTVNYGITKKMHGFNPTTGPDCTGNSNGPRATTLYIVFHTQQSKSTAVNLANFCNGSWNTTNPVSYNLAVDDVDTIEIVPVNEGPWAAGDANSIGVHICFAGSFAEWKRSKWLETDDRDGLNEYAMLARGAKAAAGAIREYGIPNVKVRVANGWPSDPKGLAGHRDFGARGGGHTDPGPENEFPWRELIGLINQYLNDEEFDMATAADLEKKIDALGRKVDLLLDQVGPKLPDWGPASSFGKDAQGRERTMRDGLIAELGEIKRAVTK